MGPCYEAHSVAALLERCTGMAANPPLMAGHNSGLFPAPYAGELIGLSRAGVEITLSGVRTRSGKWSARGTLFLSNMRLAFVATKPDAESNLQAFELPLSYIWDEDFKQPIFGANNLSGKCWLVETGEGGASIQWTLYFKEGGVGTFIPLFFRDITYVRAYTHRQQAAAAAAAAASDSRPSPAAAPSFSTSLQHALVDPSDPTVVYLTQPVSIPEGQQAAEPQWAHKRATTAAGS